MNILWGGVNLSLTRDKKFFNNEDNIDLLILRKDLNKKKLEIIKNFKKKIIFTMKEKNRITFKKNNIRVKLCIFDENPKFKNYYVHNNYIKFLKTFVDKKTLKFHKKIKYYVPLKNEQYLKFHYDNWKKKPKFPADSTSYTSHRVYVKGKQEYIYKVYRIFVNNLKNIFLNKIFHYYLSKEIKFKISLIDIKSFSASKLLLFFKIDNAVFIIAG